MGPQVQPASSGSGRESPGMRKTILIVDDEEPLLRILGLLLEEDGHRVVTARSGRLALEAYERHGADIVITDFMMPEMSGTELLATLLHRKPRLPVIVMSSLEGEVVNRACSGHAHFFRKPFDVPEFLRTVANLASGTGRDHLRLVK